MDSWNESQFLARILEAPQSCGKFSTPNLSPMTCFAKDLGFLIKFWSPHRCFILNIPWWIHDPTQLLLLQISFVPLFLFLLLGPYFQKYKVHLWLTCSLNNLHSPNFRFWYIVAGSLSPVMAFSSAVFATNWCTPFSATFLVLVSSIIVRCDKASTMFICPGKYFREENAAVAGEPSFDSCWRSGPLRINEFERFVIGPQSKY